MSSNLEDQKKRRPRCQVYRRRAARRRPRSTTWYSRTSSPAGPGRATPQRLPGDVVDAPGLLVDEVVVRLGLGIEDDLALGQHQRAAAGPSRRTD